MPLTPQDLVLSIANIFAGALDYADATAKGAQPLVALERAYTRACKRAKALASVATTVRRVAAKVKEARTCACGSGMPASRCHGVRSDKNCGPQDCDSQDWPEQ